MDLLCGTSHHGPSSAWDGSEGGSGSRPGDVDTKEWDGSSRTGSVSGDEQSDGDGAPNWLFFHKKNPPKIDNF